MIPISRLTDLHACPLPLHGITPLVSGAADVQVNGLPVARVGDLTGCGAVLVCGFPHILVNGRPMAHLGSLSSHGGALLAGSGDTFGGSQSTTPGPPLVVDFARLGVIDEQDRLDEQRLQALLADPRLEQHARQAGALIEPDKAPVVPRTYACTFQAIDSETRRPLAHRPFIARVGNEEITGLTDAAGLAHVQASSSDSSISFHVMFKAPARLLDELARPDRRFKITAQAQEVREGQARVPVTITVNDRAAVREALIRKIRELGSAFVERSAWQALPPKASLEPDWSYSRIALHHAGRSYSCSASSEQVLNTQKTHHAKGFDDISYHYAVDCFGTIYEGRDLRFKGASVLGHNTGIIGIVLLNNLTFPEEGGDWVAFARSKLNALGIDTTQQIPSQQVDATINLIEALKSVFVITHFGGHREYPDQGAAGKICPGNVGMELVRAIRSNTQLQQPAEK